MTKRRYKPRKKAGNAIPAKTAAIARQAIVDRLDRAGLVSEGTICTLLGRQMCPEVEQFIVSLGAVADVVRHSTKSGVVRYHIKRQGGDHVSGSH